MLKSLYNKWLWLFFCRPFTKREIKTGCLLLTVVLASGFVWHEITRHPEVHVRVKTLPSMEEALLQAIDLSTPLRLFTERDQHSSFPRSVKIAITRLSYDSIQVLFSEGPKLVGASTKSLFEVLFTVADKPSTEWVTGELENQKANPESLAYSRAIKTIFSDGAFRPSVKIEFIISVSENTTGENEEGYYVFWISIPQGPGNHTGYEVSKDFEIVFIDPGA